MSALLNGFMALKGGFLAAQLAPPAVLLLASPKEGRRFMDALPPDIQVVFSSSGPSAGTITRSADGTMWWSIQLMGITVRWPATRHASPDGSWYYGGGPFEVAGEALGGPPEEYGAGPMEPHALGLTMAQPCARP